MKKFYYAFLVAGAMAMTACSDDQPTLAGSNDGNVTFTIEMPGGFASRAIADGTKALDLTAAVYETDGTFLFQNDYPAAFSDLVAQVSLPLVKGKSYKVAFFAKNSAAPYTITDGNLAIDYSAVENADDNLDAFYNTADVTVTQGLGQQPVRLTRPFAQVNVGASDWAEAKRAGFAVNQAGMTFTAEVYTAMNLFNGEASNAQTVDFQLANLPEATYTGTDVATPGTLTVGDTDYTWMTMGYVLVPQNPSVINTVGFVYPGVSGTNDTFGVNSVPVQRNYRTNIVGRFFTTDVEYEIIIEPIFESDITHMTAIYDGATFYVDPTPWDGTTVREPQVHPTTGDLVVCSAAELAGLAKIINEASPASRATADNAPNVVLLTDVDLANKPWTPIGASKPNDLRSAFGFQGAFNGLGHTIKNLNVDLTACPTMFKAGLFGNFGSKNGAIENLTIENATVTALAAQGQEVIIGVGVVAGYVYTGPRDTIQNVTVKNATVKGNRQVGGILGGGYANVINCKVEDSQITAIANQLADGTYDNGDKVGGISGHITEEVKTVTGNVVKNTTITGYRDLGGILGFINNVNSTFTNNKAINVTVIASSENTYSDPVGKNTDVILGRKPTKPDDPTYTYVVDPSNTATGCKVILDTPEPTQNPDGSYSMQSPKQLTYVLENLITEGGVFNLEGDIDMTGVTIPVNTKYSKNITINGNGHTISGVSLTNSRYASLFGSNNGTTIINDLTIADSEFYGDNNTEDAEATAAAFMSFIDSWSSVEINNCKIKNVTIGHCKFMGGFVANIWGTVNINNCVVEDCKFISDFTKDGTNYQGHVGAFIGLQNNGVITNSGVKNTTFDVKGDRGGIFIGTAYENARIGEGNWIQGVTGLTNYVGEVDQRTDKTANVTVK